MQFYRTAAPIFLLGMLCSLVVYPMLGLNYFSIEGVLMLAFMGWLTWTGLNALFQGGRFVHRVDNQRKAKKCFNCGKWEAYPRHQGTGFECHNCGHSF